MGLDSRSVSPDLLDLSIQYFINMTIREPDEKAYGFERLPARGAQ